MPNALALQLQQFDHSHPNARRLLREFVDFHWRHYATDSQYIPLLDPEYLGSRLLGMTGYFEQRHHFFANGEMTCLLARAGDDVVGRCTAFVNRLHNQRWEDRTGFVGFFESVDSQEVASMLLEAAAAWLRERGMDTMRGPQNLPVNEATPGILTAGFDSRPVIYYHYNKPYYERLFDGAAMVAAKRVRSWEVPVMRPVEEKLIRVSELVRKRRRVTIETWGERSVDERKSGMLDVYNDAWDDNYGFVPFSAEEFSGIVDDMLLVMDKKSFSFAYVNGELAAFFGAVPNIIEKMRPSRSLPRWELLRAAKMFLRKGSVRGTRLGYLGVRKRFRNLGLEGVLLLEQKRYHQEHGYEYTDIGWVLEDNLPVLSLVEMMNGADSKTYTIYERAL